MICKNCQHNFEGKFCNNCGQSASVQKINFTHLLYEIPHGIFQINRGIFFTIKELFIRPGITVREYLEGKRKQHFKPLAFVFLMCTIYAFLAYFTDHSTFIRDAVTGFMEGGKSSDKNKSYTILIWLADHFAYATLLLLPFFSLASYIFFFKSKYNYVEHLVLNMFLTGQQVLIYVLFSCLHFFFHGIDDFVQGISFFASILLTFRMFFQFFATKNAFLKITLTLLTYVFYLIFIMLLLIPISFLEDLIKY